MTPRRYGSRSRAVEERVDPLDTLGGILTDAALEMSPLVNMYRGLLYEDEYPITPFATPRDRALTLLEEPEYQRYMDNVASSGMGATTKAGRAAKTPARTTKAVTPPDDPMIVQHNIHTAALDKIDRMGGLPMPSIGVSKVEHPLTGFGDISLVGRPEMATPSAKNPVYPADAYTVRFPDIEQQPTPETLDFVREMVGEKLYSEYADNIAKDLINDRRVYHPAVKNAYLKSKRKGVKRSAFPEGRDGKYAYEDEISKRLQELSPFNGADVSDYDKWLGRQKDKLLKGGTAYTERLFKGFTPSGNRKYVPVTLDNILKEMKSLQKERGTTGADLSGSMGSLRAKVTPRFTDLSDVKDARSRILPTEEFIKSRDAIEQDYNSFVNKIIEYVESIPEYRGRSVGSAEELTSDIVIGRSSKDWFPHDIPEELKMEGRKLRTKLRDMPTEYFEVKPQRAVKLSEFEGAIIPKGVSKKVKPLLKKAGIRKILEYGSEEERKALFKKFPELMFALPLISAGLLDTEQEMSSPTQSLLD